jgi:hypothetical protein
MLAFALDDPAFGILYVAVIAALTAALVFSSGIPRKWMQAVQLFAVLALGVYAGIAISGVRTDVSGTTPVNVARVSTVTPAGDSEREPPPKPGPPDGQVSIDIFQFDPAQASLHVEGWAFDVKAGAPCGAVDVAIDGKAIDRIRYGLPRPDVGAFYKDTQHVPTGFAGSVFTKGLRPGKHQVRVRCIELASNTAFPGMQLHELNLTK